MHWFVDPCYRLEDIDGYGDGFGFLVAVSILWMVTSSRFKFEEEITMMTIQSYGWSCHQGSNLSLINRIKLRIYGSIIHYNPWQKNWPN